MALKDILVGLDPSSAGESRLKLALYLARAHRAYLIACCVTGENHAAPVNPAGPGLLVAPEMRMATGEPASASLPISREAERAERSKSSSGPICVPTVSAANGSCSHPAILGSSSTLLSLSI